MYYIPLIVVCICMYIETKIKAKSIPFILAFVVMSLFLALRYGQGTDYFGYLGNYELWDYHSEIGYQLLQRCFREIGFSFELFAVLISIGQMYCMYRLITFFSPYKTFSLLLLYPTIYLTYFFSALRQGIVVAFFLGFMLRWLLEDKWIRYVIACILLATIHSCAFMLLPIVFIKKVNVHTIYIGVLVATIVGSLICVAPRELASIIQIGAVQSYIQNTSVSIVGLVERVVMALFVTFLFRKNRKDGYVTYKIEFIYKVYMYGLVISLCFAPWGILSSRLAVMMKATEIVLFPMLLAESKELIKRISCIILLCYVLVMTTKNIASYIIQGGYEGYSVITYPYISLWEKDKARELRYETWHRIETEDWWSDEPSEEQ